MNGMKNGGRTSRAPVNRDESVASANVEGGRPVRRSMPRENTKNDSPLPVRRHPAHPPPVERFNLPTVLFITVCVQPRRPVLASDEVHRALCDVWRMANHWLTGDYMIMPDHLHMFCIPGVIHPLPVKRWAEFWKHHLSVKLPRLTSGLQRDCWDTQMRDREHYLEKLAYMRENPVRAGLVEKAEDWPYQGRLNVIRW